MVETKTVKQQIEELEKNLELLKAQQELAQKVAKLRQLKKKPEPEVKERLTFEVLRVLKTNYNWKFVAGAIFAWFILWLFSH